MRCGGCGAEALARSLHGLAAERAGYGGVHHDLGEAAGLLVELLDAAADEPVVAAVECRFKFSSSGLDLFVLGAGELLPRG